MTNIFYTGINMIISMIRTSYRLKTVNRRGRGCIVGKGLEIINGQFMSFGSNIHISNYSRIETIYKSDDKYNAPNLIIGDNVTMEWFTHVACASQITIGNGTLIGSNVFITDHNHAYTSPDTYKVDPSTTPLEIKPVHIGERCWIGEHVCILPGVTIGDDCIIGAGAVVTKDIPDSSIAVGVPAKPIKYRDEHGEWVFIKNPS